MSFSSQVRAELSALKLAKPCCLDAELRAMTRCRAGLSFRETGELRLRYRSGNPSVVKRAYILLKSLQGISATASRSQKAGVGGRRQYSLRLDAEDTKRLLAALEASVEDREGKPRLRVPVTIPRRECCRRAYARGMLLACGSVGDPRKAYQAEFVLPDRRNALLFQRILSLCGVKAARASRRGAELLTIRGAERVIRLLTLVGAARAVLMIENQRVSSSLNNRLNRAMNCDQANLDRQISASRRQLEAISTISLARGLSSLTPALHELARLRLAHREVSLEQLGALLDPPLGKSAIQQRMRRLLSLADEITRTEGALL